MATESIKIAGVRFTADEVEAVRITRGGFDVRIVRLKKPEGSDKK